MARVALSEAAVESLDRLVITHSLPPDTRARVKRSLSILTRFPLIGRALEDQWEGLRFLIGPWRWLLIIYLYDASDDLVVVVTIQDARSSSAVTSA